MTHEPHASNGFEDLTVELVNVSHRRPFELFWRWFRETWLDLHDVDYDPNDLTHVQACKDVANRRALPTPMEALNFEIRIDGISRVALAQITRGRIGHCYNVQSQMPQRIKHSVTIPKNIYEHPIFGERARKLHAKLAELYDEMYNANIPPQDCRYLTLHGQQTSLMWHVNYGALLGWYSRRCENGLTDELNLVGRKLRKLLIDEFIDIDASGFRYDDPSTWTDKDFGSGWSFLIAKLDCMGAQQRVCLNNDRVFGNTGRFKSAGEWVPSPTNAANAPDYRFDMSAFFYELLDLPDELLFPGEREMIDDWRALGFVGRIKKLDGDDDVEDR